RRAGAAVRRGRGGGARRLLRLSRRAQDRGPRAGVSRLPRRQCAALEFLAPNCDCDGGIAHRDIVTREPRSSYAPCRTRIYAAIMRVVVHLATAAWLACVPSRCVPG